MALYTGNNYAAIKMMKNMKQHGNVLDTVSEKHWLQIVCTIWTHFYK